MVVESGNTRGSTVLLHPFIVQSSGGKPAGPLNLTVELCSRDQGLTQVSPRSPNLPITAVTILVLLGVLVVVPLAVPLPAHAQAVYGSIFGTLTDQSGAAVVGASLTVTSVQKNIKFETSSNEAGNYNVTHLIPDHYNVRFEAPGFKVVESTGIPVYADEAARVDVKLQVGGAEE